ncbi:Protein NEDD1 [Thelohanellus kitauei]|uniref:Protein NEDD1 n=1 Tax=Thelohanellus kitauei TaxID=669202 RepID=A0A0C2MVY8_THEKT|nr:Protein NEDD1 [Thelohanellus kitauei]
MSTNKTNHVGSTISSTVSFFTTHPLTLLSWNSIAFDIIDSFSWSCDNRRYCCSSSSQDFAHLFSTTNNGKLMEFGKNLKFNLHKFTNTAPNYVLSSGNSNVSILWDVKQSPAVALKGFKHPSLTCSKAISFNLDDSLLAIAGKNISENIFLLFDVNETLVMKSYLLEMNELPAYLEFSPTSKNQIALATTNGTLIIYDSSVNQPLLKLKNEQECSACGMYFMPNTRNEVCIGYNNNRIAIYNLMHRQTTGSIVIKNNITSFAPLCDGVNFLVGSDVGTLYQYDMRKKETPVDILRIDKSKLSAIHLQKDKYVMPPLSNETNVNTESTESCDKFGTKKRRAKEAEVKTPLLRSHHMKDFKNLFTSPAFKKIKMQKAAPLQFKSDKTVGSEQDIGSIERLDKESSKIISNEKENTAQIDQENQKPRPLLNLLFHLQSCVC